MAMSAFWAFVIACVMWFYHDSLLSKITPKTFMVLTDFKLSRHDGQDLRNNNANVFSQY